MLGISSKNSFKLTNSLDLSEIFCFGVSCLFTYNDTWLSNSNVFLYQLCNSAGGCLSNQQSFPFTLNSGGEGINAGIYFLGEVDFNGTIISSGNNNSIQSKNSKIGFPQSSFFSSLFTLVLIMMYFLV